jgi:hypothetical protein
MELKDFISATLLEILEGVKAAQEKATDFGATISPELGPQAQGALQNKGVQNSNTLQVIEFVVYWFSVTWTWLSYKLKRSRSNYVKEKQVMVVRR